MMRFGGVRIPRDLGLAISNCTYLLLVLITTVLCLLLTFICIIFEVWDVTVYDVAALSVVKYNDSSKRSNSSTSSSNSTSGQLLNAFEVLDDGAVLFDSRGRCENTISGLNGTFLTEERGGVWRLYRIFADEEQQALAEHLCNTSMHSLNYMNHLAEIDFYCCGGCCPFESQWRFEADRAGETTHDALFTLMSSVIVTLILQGVSVLMIMVGLCNKSVTLYRMTGVTILLSGLFLMFALTINHYKISIMNTGFRSIAYLSVDILNIRKTSAGWCMYVGWVAVFFSLVSSSLLVQFSRFMVKLALETPDSPYHQSTTDRKPQLLNNPQTAIEQVRTARAKSATKRLSSSMNLQSNSNAANGHVNSSFVAVQEL
uniref:Uncharacterized protein n=1 Tax=Plectus sambesii TaxID=2011161 RepID=A0A914WHA4_9BILA